MWLREYDAGKFSRGATLWVEAAWVLCNSVFLASWIPGSNWRCVLLRAFGAEIGRRVVVKPSVRVKFPWKLRIGDDSWIGEGVWIDNLADVQIGANVCISQGAYLCAGSHDWSSPKFTLVTKEIRIADCVWIGAFSRVGPGSNLEEGVVLGLGGVASGRLERWSIFRGNPAKFFRERRVVGKRSQPLS